MQNRNREIYDLTLEFFDALERNDLEYDRAPTALESLDLLRLEGDKIVGRRPCVKTEAPLYEQP